MRTLISFLLLFHLGPAAFAHNAPTDELGCHSDPATGGYHCTTGPLSGLEFMSKDEAKEAYEKRKSTAEKDKGKGKKPDAKAKAKEASLDDEEEDFTVTTRKAGTGSAEPDERERFSIVSWRLKKGASKLDHDRIASVITDADVAVLQDVEFNEHGQTALTVIANLVEKRAGEKVCKAWFKNAKGKRNRFGFIWRERQIGLVDSAGEMHDSCSTKPIVIRSEAKDYGYATFYLKTNRKLFVLTSVDLGSGSRDIPSLFRAYADTGWAVIFAGDLKTPVKSGSFKDVRKWNFKPALTAGAPKDKKHKGGGGLGNLWFKNIALIEATSVNLYEQFPELKPADLEASVGESFPMRGEFTFSERDAEVMQTQLISKRKGKMPASVSAPVVLSGPSYPAAVDKAQLSNLKEDIESEESAIDPGKKSGGSKPKSGKKKKKK